MKVVFPFYGITGNGVDTWSLDIFWGGARHNKTAVQNVAKFIAKPVGEHSTPSRTQVFRETEYLRAKQKAVDELERLELVDPIRKSIQKDTAK